jgi:hypothetical protein
VWTVKLAPINAVLAVQTSDDLPEVTPNKELIFPSDSANIRDAYLVIVREKNARFSFVRVRTIADRQNVDSPIVCI